MHVSTTRRAFTLIELLVVMIVIAVIIAIVVPVLGQVRHSARRAGTAGLLDNVNQAIVQFENDERRLPGYFPEEDVGAAANGPTVGFTSMENILMDLMGAVPQTASAQTIEVGPYAAGDPRRINIDPSLLGSGSGGSKAYYTPDGKLYIAQVSPLQQQGGPGSTAATESAPQLKDLVDYWGQPILAWRQNDRALGPVTTLQNFARVTSQAGAAPSRFYWQSNAAFLSARGLGRRGRDQTDAEAGSLIGSQIPNAQREQSLAAILGNPSAPYRDPANPSNAPAFAVAGRGKIILHSAGVDAVYFGRKDPGAVRQFGGGPLDYRKNFVPDITQPMGPSNQYTTEDGQADVHDLTKDFDDLTAATGG